MQKRDIIVVGSSAGGLSPLLELVAGLPPNLNASVFILRHFPTNERSGMAALLSWHGNIKATDAINGEPIKKAEFMSDPQTCKCCCN